MIQFVFVLFMLVLFSTSVVSNSCIFLKGFSERNGTFNLFFDKRSSLLFAISLLASFCNIFVIKYAPYDLCQIIFGSASISLFSLFMVVSFSSLCISLLIAGMYMCVLTKFSTSPFLFVISGVVCGLLTTVLL